MAPTALLLLAALTVAATGGPDPLPGPVSPPVLDVRAPASMQPQQERLERFDTRRLLAVMRLIGLRGAGPPILVVLVPRHAPLARETPAWNAGFATADGAIVLFPERSPSYPHDTLEDVLQHEVAHVLIGRAAGDRPVPRWFHEGVALAAERAWSLGERAHFVYEAAFAGPVPAQALDALFTRGPGAVARAYSLSGALVEDLLETYGPDLPARVFDTMRQGRRFDDAFVEVAGSSVAEASDAFWRRQRVWVTWLPWVTSPDSVYAVMTLLALVAILRVRARRAAWRRLQDEEARAPDREPPPER